jgi:hypothetical protein
MVLQTSLSAEIRKWSTRDAPCSDCKLLDRNPGSTPSAKVVVDSGN